MTTRTWEHQFTCKWTGEGQLDITGFPEDMPMSLQFYLTSIRPEKWPRALKLIQQGEGHCFANEIGILFPFDYESSSSEEDQPSRGPLPEDEVEFFAGYFPKDRVKKNVFLQIVKKCLEERKKSFRPLDREYEFLDYVRRETTPKRAMYQDLPEPGNKGIKRTTSVDSLAFLMTSKQTSIVHPFLDILDLATDIPEEDTNFTDWVTNHDTKQLALSYRMETGRLKRLELKHEITKRQVDSQRHIVQHLQKEVTRLTKEQETVQKVLLEEKEKNKELTEANKSMEAIINDLLAQKTKLTNKLVIVGREEHVQQKKALDESEREETLPSTQIESDPRAWTREQVNEWIISQGCHSMDLHIEGDELCRKPRRWFMDNFPGMGQKLRDDLQRRRDAIANERMFADKGRTEKRVTEGTRVAFLTMAFQICMIFYLLREQLQKASKILQHLYALLNVVKRRAGKNKVDPDLFREGRIQSSITSRAAVGSDKVTLVHGSECIDVTGETNSKAVTTMCEAMNVIGADLKIKFKIALWKKVAFGAAAASAVGLTAGGAAVFFGASMGAGAAIGGIASLGTVAALVIADHQGNERLLQVYAIFLETEGKTVEFESNYLKAVLLSTKIVDRTDMTESQLERIIADVKRESRASVIKQVERAVIDKLPDISKGDLRLSWSGNIHDAANFNYRATAWLHDDSVKDVNDSILIACIQFGMRNLLRDVFILGVIGPENKSKKDLMKLVFPNTVHELEQKSCDMVLYDGSEYMQSTLPVMLFPSGKTKAIEAALGLWTRSCSAFICVVDYTRGIPDLEDLEVVSGLCVPVLLCINTNGRLLGREAERAIDTYKSYVSYGLRDLVQVILVDVSGTDKSPWITGGGDVKYWVQDVHDHHQELACNMIDKDFRDSL